MYGNALCIPSLEREAPKKLDKSCITYVCKYKSPPDSDFKRQQQNIYSNAAQKAKSKKANFAQAPEARSYQTYFGLVCTHWYLPIEVKGILSLLLLLHLILLLLLASSTSHREC